MGNRAGRSTTMSFTEIRIPTLRGRNSTRSLDENIRGHRIPTLDSRSECSQWTAATEPSAFIILSENIQSPKSLSLRPDCMVPDGKTLSEPVIRIICSPFSKMVHSDLADRFPINQTWQKLLSSRVPAASSRVIWSKPCCAATGRLSPWFTITAGVNGAGWNATMRNHPATSK